MTVLLSIAYARILGDVEYGKVAYLLSLMSVLSIFVLIGIPDFLTREVSRQMGERNWGTVRSLLSWSNKFITVNSIVVMVFYIGGVWLFTDDLEKRYLFWLGAPLLYLLSINERRSGILQGFMKIIEGQMSDLFIKPLLLFTFLLLAALILPGHSLKAFHLIIIYIVASVGALLLGVLFMNRSIPPEIRLSEPSLIRKGWLKESSAFFLLRSMWVLNGSIDLVMIGALLPSEEAAYYKVASTAALLVGYLTASIGQTLAPVISDYYNRNDLQTLQNVLTKTVRVTSLVTPVLSLGLILTGKFAIRIFYGEDFLPAYYPMAVLSISAAITAMGGSVGIALSMSGNQGTALKVQIVTSIFNIFLNLFLIHLWGIIGAAIATGITQVVMTFGMVYYLKKITGLKSYIR